MPVYGYKCTSCEHVFEQVRKISEYNVPCEEGCPECGKQTVQRYIDSAPTWSKSGCRTRIKQDAGFSTVLNRIKKFYKGNTIDTN